MCLTQWRMDHILFIRLQKYKRFCHFNVNCVQFSASYSTFLNTFLLSFVWLIFLYIDSICRDSWIHKMLELNIFKDDQIHFLFNKAPKRLGTGHKLAKTWWDWDARLLTVRPIIFFPLYNNASFLFDWEMSLLISILFWNRDVVFIFIFFMREKLDCFLFFLSLWLWPELSNKGREIYPL